MDNTRTVYDKMWATDKISISVVGIIVAIIMGAVAVYNLHDMATTAAQLNIFLVAMNAVLLEGVIIFILFMWDSIHTVVVYKVHDANMVEARASMNTHAANFASAFIDRQNVLFGMSIDELRAEDKTLADSIEIGVAAIQISMLSSNDAVTDTSDKYRISMIEAMVHLRSIRMFIGYHETRKVPVYSAIGEFVVDLNDSREYNTR